MKTRITPFLWFDDQAEEAMKFYTSIFENSKVGSVMRYGEEGPGPKATVMSATFPARRAGVHRAERRPDIHVLAGHLVLREVRDTGGSGSLLGEALCRRRDPAVRVAQGQVRGFVADRPHDPG
jgi:3-demethylubiquinone-9 3-methyltransferase